MSAATAKGLSLIRCLLRDYAYLFKNVGNILKLKIRYKTSTIRFPLQASFSDINNIHIADDVFIDSRSIIRIIDNCTLHIGEGTNIGLLCHISGTKNRIVIGENVLIAPRVYISTTNRRYDDVSLPIIKQGYTSKGDVVIDDGCWIGVGSCILSGAHIGKNTVIGANSVVTKNVPAYSVAAGNPARVIKHYCFTKKKWVTHSHT